MSQGLSETSVEQVLRQAAAGDAVAWRQLVQWYSTRVFALLVRQCRDRELAEEITQATFVQVVAHIDRYRELGKFEPWLFRIAMNRLRDELRRRKRQAQPMDMSESRDDAATGQVGWSGEDQLTEMRRGGQPEGPVDLVSQGEEIEILKQAVAELNEADREILYLRHTAGLSFAEIAQSLGQPLGTVLARGHRALGKLRKMLEERGLESKDR